ncbi:unnamed protein product [Allacma fusca]|uniref:Uncharacterized protein n=1 Tax=Allacma fusca TaxID=39272 RepID=A0A8J2JZF5_9HEXA|nr:unnamed protein product [Allacma fusca]
MIASIFRSNWEDPGNSIIHKCWNGNVPQSPSPSCFRHAVCHRLLKFTLIFRRPACNVAIFLRRSNANSNMRY